MKTSIKNQKRARRLCKRHTAKFPTFVLGLMLGVCITVIAIKATPSTTDTMELTEALITATVSTQALDASVEPILSPSEPLYDATPINCPTPDPDNLTRLAKTVWGEARGVQSTAEQAAVIWCILNRVDDPRWPDTITGVCITSQFNGYDPDNPVEPELYDLALDVYSRWCMEKQGEKDVGRVLPAEYVYFTGDGTRNTFTTEFLSGNTWGFTLPDPYQ